MKNLTSKLFVALLASTVGTGAYAAIASKTYVDDQNDLDAKVANISTSITTDTGLTTKFTSVKAVEDYVGDQITTITSNVDGKQALSTANYQMGNAAGGWTAMDDGQQAALNSGVTATDVAQITTNKTDIATNAAAIALKEASANKSSTLTVDEGQENVKFPTVGAVNTALEGITSEIDVDLGTKQDKSTAAYSMGGVDGTWVEMTTAQQGALNSGVTATDVAQITTNKTDIATNAAAILTKQNKLSGTAGSVVTYTATDGVVGSATLGFLAQITPPSGCAEEANTCVLTTDGTNVIWEVTVR